MGSTIDRWLRAAVRRQVRKDCRLCPNADPTNQRPNPNAHVVVYLDPADLIPARNAAESPCPMHPEA